MNFLKHILILITLKLPIQLIGILICYPICCKYKLGQFPKWCKWFDDYKGRHIKNQNANYVVKWFGSQHHALYKEYNKTPLKRYIWCAFRNPINVFQHEVLGKHYKQKTSLWEFYKYYKIPLINKYLRIRIGYKVGDKAHQYMVEKLNFHYQWVFSIGVRNERSA